MKYVSALALSMTVLACSQADSESPLPSLPSPTPATSFKGRGGIYFLGSADVPIPNAAFSNVNVSGVVVRFMWGNLETAPGVFNWAFIDGELSKARSNHKKVSIQVLGYPNWVVSTLNAASYRYIDKNSFHTTYLDTLSDVLPWDAIYLSRIRNLIDQFSVKYASDTSVVYFNMISSQISRGLPDSVIQGNVLRPFYVAVPYNADTVVAKMKPLLDHYMTKFPTTPLWNSVDYVSFEQRASGRAVNYLAQQYVNYGVAQYPDRFGCFREDIAACNPPRVIQQNQWQIMAAHPTRTGAQMLWSVQDGPTRMNQCGIVPNTKTVVIDSSFNNGLRLGMRYFEVYGADISDASLAPSMSRMQALLKSRYTL